MPHIKQLFGLVGVQTNTTVEIFVGLVLLLLGMTLMYFIIHWVSRPLYNLCSKTKIGFIQLVPQFQLAHKLGYVFMPIVFRLILWALIPNFVWLSFLSSLADIVGLCLLLNLIFAVLNMTLFWCSHKKWADDLPLYGISQTLKLVTTIIVILLIISILIGQSPVYLLSGLGVMTSVLLLVFREPILGLVASIQLSANKALKVGDWMEMPSYSADGNVEYIGLTTLKVRNWDNTATMIPTSALLSNAFRNWRAMQESGRRRIKRALYVNADSVRFLTLREKQTLIEEFPYLHDAFELHTEEISNLTAFRYFMENHLKKHPMISDRLTCMVRISQIEARGIPVELYCFTRTTVWTEYEAIQSSLFEFVYASLGIFYLEPYQALSGSLRSDRSLRPLGESHREK